MIIRNPTSCSKLGLNTADNHRQLTDHGLQADHGPQLIELNFKPNFLWLLVKKRIIRIFWFTLPIWAR